MNKWDQKLCSARFILQKHTILRLLTDLEPIVLDLEPIVLDRSRVGNQSIYNSNRGSSIIQQNFSPGKSGSRHVLNI